MEIVILGNGGHSKVIQEMIHTIKEYRIIAILDDKFKRSHVNEGMIYGPLSLISEIISSDTKIIIAIGDNMVRKSLSQKLLVRDNQFLTLVHPTAVVSTTATLGFGTVVMPGAYINAESKIGEHCIINTGAIVEHGSDVGHFSHVSPNTTLTGEVSIGEGVHIGASATIIPGTAIGNWSIIGAGSTVIQNIPPDSVAVGSPTRIIRKKRKENYEDKAVM